MDEETRLIASSAQIHTSIFLLLSDLLSRTKNTISFEEILQNVPRSTGDAVVIRVVPILTGQKKTFLNGFFAGHASKVERYGLSFGSSEKIYASPSEIEHVFTKYFSPVAKEKALSLILPLVRMFLRKGVWIDSELLQEIERLDTSWIITRQLGRQTESIIYFMQSGKLIRIDTERVRIIAGDIIRFREKLIDSYPHIGERKSQLFALHEIALNAHTSNSLLLPNNGELLTDVDKEDIRQALLADPESPKTFAKKLEALLSFDISLLTDLKNEELRLYSHLLHGTLFNFIVALNSVVRWSRQPEEEIDKKTGKKSIILTYQDSKDPKKVETDLDHTITMLGMASQIFATQKYPHLAQTLIAKNAMNEIFIHDGGEPFSPFGDVTHADEERWQQLSSTKNEVESEVYMHWWQRRMRLQGLHQDVLKDLYAGFLHEEGQKTRENTFVKFLDHFQAVIYGIQNIYPYEAVYKDSNKLKEFIRKYALKDVYMLMRRIGSQAQVDLRRFFIDQLPLSFIETSYKEAELSGRLEKNEAKEFIQAIVETLQILYESSPKGFMKQWDKLQKL